MRKKIFFSVIAVLLSISTLEGKSNEMKKCDKPTQVILDSHYPFISYYAKVMAGELSNNDTEKFKVEMKILTDSMNYMNENCKEDWRYIPMLSISRLIVDALQGKIDMNQYIASQAVFTAAYETPSTKSFEEQVDDMWNRVKDK